MLRDPSAVIATFWSNVPKDFVADTFATIFESYGVAYETCGAIMDSSERYDVVAAMRRGVIETNIRNVARQYPTAEVHTRRNKRKTSHFSLLQFGAVDLTVSKSGSPKAMPRPAVYRTNFLEDAQLSFFATREATRDDRLYALLLHGPARRKKRADEANESIGNPRWPSFARIVFPDETGVIFCGIDLFQDFRAVVDRFIPPVEKVELAEPKPLRIRKKENE